MGDRAVSSLDDIARASGITPKHMREIAKHPVVLRDFVCVLRSHAAGAPGADPSLVDGAERRSDAAACIRVVELCLARRSAKSDRKA